MPLALLENYFIINRVTMPVKSKNQPNEIGKFVFYCCFVLSTIRLVSGTPPAGNVDLTSDEVEELEDFIHEVLKESKEFESMNFDAKPRDELTLQAFTNAFRVDKDEGKEEFFTALYKIKIGGWRCWSLRPFNIVQSVTRAPHEKRYTKAVAEQLKKGGIVDELIYTTKKFAGIIDVVRHMPEELNETIENDFVVPLTLFLVDAEFGDQEQWKMAVQQVYALAEIGVTHQQLGELIKFCERKQEKGELTLKLLEEKLTLLRRIWQLPVMQLYLIPEKRRWLGDTYLENDKKDAEERRERKLNERRQLLFRLMLPLIPADVEKVFEAINRNYGRDRDIDIYNVGRNLVIYNL